MVHYSGITNRKEKKYVIEWSCAAQNTSACGMPGSHDEVSSIGDADLERAAFSVSSDDSVPLGFSFAGLE